MTVWVDAQLSPALARWLASRFSISALHVRDVVSISATDREIFSAARASNAVILTKDRDFVDLIRRYGSPPSVIWVTCGNTSNAMMFRTPDLTFASTCSLLEAGETFVEIKA